MKTPAHFSFDVFLSHNSKDNAQVRRLAERLRAAGMRVWFDEWVIKPGDDIYLAIERGLEAARSLVLCLSPAALGSDWVGLERSTALFRDPSNVGRRFIPILLADCTLPDTLRRYKYVDFRQEADAAFEELLNACGVATEGFQTLPEDTAILPQPVGEEHFPTAVRSLLEQGRKLIDEGCYPEARRKIESAKQAGETANNAAAVLESRIQIAQIAIREQRDVTAARDELLDCLHNLSADGQAKKREKVLGLLGDAEIFCGSVEEAMSLYREARQLAQKRNDRFAEAPYLIGLSHAEELLGNLKEAHSLLNEATGLYRAEYRDATGEEKRRTATNLGATYSTKAKLLRHEGKVTDAIICLARAQPLFREANSRDNLGRVLVFKAEILLNEGSREDGFEALKEALSIFESIGNVGWQCRCLDDMAHFSFKSGDDAAALVCLRRALHLVGSERPQIEAVPYLLKSAHLCQDHDQAEKAKVFVERAKEIAARAGDDGLMATCLVAEASTLDGTAARATRENLFRCAVKHLDSALAKCEVKGRRAEYMRQIGDLYGWLRDIHEARGWFEQALREYEEIGDVRGLGACLASLAAAAREEKSPAEAIAMLEHLIAFSEGKPLHYDRAGALHDLGMLKLSQGDVGEANRCLEAAKALAEKHGFRDVLAALQVSLERLADAERFYQPSSCINFRADRQEMP